MVKRMLFLGAVALLLVPVVSAEFDPNGFDLDRLLDGFFSDRVGPVCLEMTGNPGVAWEWDLQGDASRQTRSATVLGGAVGGTICDAPNWTVTSGSVDLVGIHLEATHTGTGVCTESVTLDGLRGPGRSRVYTGEYCFDTGACFPQQITLKNLGPC